MMWVNMGENVNMLTVTDQCDKCLVQFKHWMWVIAVYSDYIYLLSSII